MTKQIKSSVNVLSISIGQLLTLLINFFSVSFTARYLGVEDYGTFNYLLATVFIASKISDLGLSNIIFRETSKSPNEYVDVSVGISIRIITFFIVALLLNISILFLHFDTEKTILINIPRLSSCP